MLVLYVMYYINFGFLILTYIQCELSVLLHTAFQACQVYYCSKVWGFILKEVSYA